MQKTYVLRLYFFVPSLMLFKQKQLEGIIAGEISLAFRRWQKPNVLKGSLLKTSIGLVEVTDITSCTLPELSERQATQAGYSSLMALKAELNKRPDDQLYKIKVRYHAADPRISLRQHIKLTTTEWEALAVKVARLDAYSKQGTWTFQILKAIQDYPRLKAADLAIKTGKEKEWLKLNIRKLKNLGLTISHEPGYSLSPLGIAFLKYIADK
jgi:hypothetical protein